MGKLRIMDRTGDSVLEWDPAVKEDVDHAQAKFNEVIRQGYMAYKSDTAMVAGRRSGGEVIRKFDPAADEILMAAPLQGG